MATPTQRKWLRYFENHILAWTTVCLPLGVVIVFPQSEYGLPLWPAALITPALVTLIARHQVTHNPGRRDTRRMHLLMAATMGVAITLLEAPWRDSYDEMTFWLHGLAMAVGGGLTAIMVCVSNILALVITKRGPFRGLIPAGPYIMLVAGTVAGFISGYIISVFSLFTWTWGIADLGPAFIPLPVFITAVTAIVFLPLGLVLGFMSQQSDGNDSMFQGSSFDSPSFSPPPSSSSGSSHDDE